MTDETATHVDESVELDESVQRLNKDLREAAVLLSDAESRYLVDAYYQVQELRKAAFNQAGALAGGGEPNRLLAWYANQAWTLERQIFRAMDRYTDVYRIGRWSKSILGIGPVLSAGLMAHIDIEKAETTAAIWRFAGLDPTVRWEKGCKRPWNAQLKTLCWKIGESFCKVSGKPDSLYGQAYRERKAEEQARNERYEFANQAADKLERFNIGKDTDAYKWYSVGKLPPAHIDQRAKRWAVKLFLSHWHEIAYEAHFGNPAPAPYAIAHMEHAHYQHPPNRHIT